MTFDKYTDIIDSRDVIARIEELNDLVAEGEIDEEDTAELLVLEALAEEASCYAEDWIYGAALIRDSYFTEYAQQLADDLAPSHEMREVTETWPYNCIDWEQAARVLQQDYTSVDFDGVDFWIR